MKRRLQFCDGKEQVTVVGGYGDGRMPRPLYRTGNTLKTKPVPKLERTITTEESVGSNGYDPDGGRCIRTGIGNTSRF